MKGALPGRVGDKSGNLRGGKEGGNNWEKKNTPVTSTQLKIKGKKEVGL